MNKQSTLTQTVLSYWSMYQWPSPKIATCHSIGIWEPCIHFLRKNAAPSDSDLGYFSIFLVDVPAEWDGSLFRTPVAKDFVGFCAYFCGTALDRTVADVYALRQLEFHLNQLNRKRINIETKSDILHESGIHYRNTHLHLMSQFFRSSIPPW